MSALLLLGIICGSVAGYTEYKYRKQNKMGMGMGPFIPIIAVAAVMTTAYILKFTLLA